MIAARRRAGPHPAAATTTPTARTDELAWIDWDLDADETDLLDFTRRLVRAAAGPPGVPAAPLLRRHAGPARTSPTSRHRLVRAGRPRTWTTRTGAPATPGPSWCSSTATRSPSRTCAASRSSTTASWCCSTGSPTRRRSRCRPAGSATSGRRWWTPTRRSRPAARVQAGTSLALREKSIIVFTRPSILPSPTSSGIGAVAVAASEAAKQTKSRGHGEPADEKPKRRTTKPRPSA